MTDGETALSLVRRVGLSWWGPTVVVVRVDASFDCWWMALPGWNDVLVSQASRSL